MTGAKKIILEDEHRVHQFRRYLPETDARNEALVQFFAVQGGMRTIAVNDIVDIS